MAVYPRQKLYEINHAGFASAALTGRLNNGDDGQFERAFCDFTGIKDENFLSLSRGRLSLYFATKNNVAGSKNKVIMSPFTIFDVINMSICGGGKPHFVDSAPGSPHVTLETLKREIDDNTALVVITHYHTVNPEIEDIAAFLADRNIPLLEDCAISLGCRVNGKHVGTFGDYALFSFGLFKFIATYFGGGMYVKDSQERDRIAGEISTWPKMKASDLFPYVRKGLKFSTLTNPAIFNVLTFPLFRYGYVNDINFIKKNAVNDPNPELKLSLPESYQRKPSDFQMRDWTRQLPGILAKRDARLDRAEIYADKFRGSNTVRNTHNVERESDGFLNYPINVTDAEAVLKAIMKKGYDASPYFYRNCAKLECFKEYARELPNIDAYARDMIILPTYPSVPKKYVAELADVILQEAAALETARGAA